MRDVGREGDGVEYVLMARDEGMEEEANPEKDKSDGDRLWREHVFTYVTVRHDAIMPKIFLALCFALRNVWLLSFHYQL
jgi:hypothetical protein